MNKEMFSKMTINNIIGSLINSMPIYRSIINDESKFERLSDGGKAWCSIHDKLSWYYGYYGDLDLYIDKYEETLSEKVYTMKSMYEFNELIDNINQAELRQEELLEERKKQGWNIIEM